MYKEILSKMKFEESEHSEYSYASEMGYCQRKTWYKRKGNPFYHNFATEVNFAQGNAIHDLVQSIFETRIAPMLGFRAIREVRINNMYIHGFIDVLLVNKDEIRIIEIKTTKTLPDKPYPHHINQLNTYMQPYIANQDKHHKKVTGTLFYIEKAVVYGNSPQREFNIEYNEDMFIETMQKAEELNEALENNILPPAEALINRNYWECRLCTYFVKCRKAGRDAIDLTINTTPEKDLVVN